MILIEIIIIIQIKKEIVKDASNQVKDNRRSQKIFI